MGFRAMKTTRLPTFNSLVISIINQSLLLHNFLGPCSCIYKKTRYFSFAPKELIETRSEDCFNFLNRLSVNANNCIFPPTFLLSHVAFAYVLFA